MNSSDSWCWLGSWSHKESMEGYGEELIPLEKPFVLSPSDPPRSKFQRMGSLKKW